MAAPFCIACGATVADGTRFCVKCGQPVGQGQAAPPAVGQTTVVMTPPPPPLVPPIPPPISQRPISQAPVWTPPPPPPPPPFVQPIAAQPMPAKGGSGVGIWIGLFGFLLLLGGAGLWFYTTRMAGAHPASTVQVASTSSGSTPSDAAPVQPTPAPSTATPSPTPDPAQPASQPTGQPVSQPTGQPTGQPTPTPNSTFVPAPTPNPTTEVIPPNPDQAAPKQPLQSRPQPPQTRPAASAPSDQGARPSAAPVKAARQTSGVLHASVEVAQNGEVVFENLPGGRLKFTFDHSAWQPTISRQANGTQTLVMRSLKPGLQRSCDVTWEIAP